MNSFLGKDKTAIDEVLLTFKNDTGKNLHELKLAVATNNITQINSTTHRMLPMFRQLHVNKIVPTLETFETLKKNDSTHKSISEIYAKLEQEISDVIEAISQEISTGLNHNS